MKHLHSVDCRWPNRKGLLPNIKRARQTDASVFFFSVFLLLDPVTETADLVVEPFPVTGEDDQVFQNPANCALVIFILELSHSVLSDLNCFIQKSV